MSILSRAVAYERNILIRVACVRPKVPARVLRMTWQVVVFIRWLMGRPYALRRATLVFRFRSLVITVGTLVTFPAGP